MIYFSARQHRGRNRNLKEEVEMKTLKLVIAILAISGLAAGPASGGQAPAKSMKGAATHSEAASALKQDMRKLWTDHVVWTRDYIVAAVGDQPDAQAAAARLMKNQEDIGQAVSTY